MPAEDLDLPIPRQPETSSLTSDDAASDFRCESAELTRFFKELGTQNQRRDVNRTWVLRRREERTDQPQILGFYTLTIGGIESERLPERMAKRLPSQYPVPIVLIGRLARDERVRGLGVGEHLLADAHLRALAINVQAGGVAVVVDAKDPRAYDFYARFGYRPLGATDHWPKSMFLPIETLRKSYAASAP